MRLMRKISKSGMFGTVGRYSFANASELYNPYTRKFLSSKQYLTDEEIAPKMKLVTHAHNQWRNTPLETRAELVTRFVDAILKDKDIMKHHISSELGKSYNNID
jgi:acyl-CoA reductase-like NAD-dependent aldehyde dehydrogenase